jgi:hypothetical protein
MKKRNYCLNQNCVINELTQPDHETTCPLCEEEIVDANQHDIEVQEDIDACRQADEEDIRMYGDWREDVESMNHKPTVCYNEDGEPLGWD